MTLLKTKGLHLNQGSTLIEVLVAGTIVVTTLVAALGLVIYSVDRTSQTKHQAQALSLSQNMMELFLKERAVLGWNSFFQKMSHTGNRFCTGNLGDDDPLNDELVECSGYDNISFDGTTYSRYAEVTEYNDVDRFVTVEVVTRWPEGKVGERQVSTKHRFFKIN